MSDHHEARNRATRLLAMAWKARKEGAANADDLARLANQAVEQAEALARGAAVPPTPEAPQQVAQQQQQPQPKEK